MLYGFLTSFLIVFLSGRKFIAFVKKQQGEQPIRDDGPESHLVRKQGTPTMGGLLIIIATVISTLIWGQLGLYTWLCIAILVGFGAIGLIDDYTKISRHDYHGITAKTKIILQFLIAFVICFIAIKYAGLTSVVRFLGWNINLGIFFIFWAIFVIIGSSNAVNLTDGLDGLAIGPIVTTGLGLAFICFAAGDISFASLLNIKYLPEIAELTTFLGCLVGASLGFLWFNAPPAKIFMGDTGSIAIGAALGFVAIIIKQEVIYAIMGGIFVLEAVSVIIQVAGYKLTGKRIFLMAPLHHHFEKKGEKETAIVFRFWIISIVLLIIGLGIIR